MLFVVAVVVSAAGCANKKRVTNNTTDTTNLVTESRSNNPVTTEVPIGKITLKIRLKIK